MKKEQIRSINLWNNYKNQKAPKTEGW